MKNETLKNDENIETSNYLRFFSFLFTLVGVTLTLVILSVVSYKLIDTNEKTLKDKAIFETNAKIEKTMEFYLHFSKFLNTIEENRFFTSYLKDENLENKKDLITLFKTLASHEKNLTQLRYLDENGQEIVRVDRNKINENIFLIEEEKLQNKKHRDYFYRTMEKNKGELFVSNLNLNIENKQIEKPLKPVWRFALPVFLDDTPKGIIIVNVFGKYLLDDLIASDLFYITIYDQNKHTLVTNDNSKNIWTKYLKTNSQILTEEFLVSQVLIDGINDETLFIGFKPKKTDNIFKIIGYDFIYLTIFVLVLSFLLANYISRIPKKFILKLSSQNKALQKKDETISEYVILSKTDKRGVITEVTDAFCKLSGYSKEELIGNTHAIVRHPQTSDEFIKDIWDNLKSEKTWRGEIRNKNKNGRDYWVDANISPEYDYHGNHIGYLSIRHDITANKEFLRRLNIEKDKANKANEAKSEFLANMSHEIRTPLNGIIGLTELCLDTKLNHTQKDFLQKALYSSKSLLQIINDILDYSKIEANKLEINNEVFELDSLLVNISNLFSYKIYEKGLEFNYTVSPEIPLRLKGDSLRLTQVLNNFISNSVKFTHNGHIQLEITLLEKIKDEVVLEFKVKDTGIGISKENQHKLFKSFSQEDSSTTKKYGGSGLVISKKLVELMNGKIFFESHKGFGSVFAFRLNLKYLEDKKLFDLNAKHQFENKKFLVVDDSEIDRDYICNILKTWKINPKKANDGAHALDILRVESFDYMIVDWKMPKIDGLTLIEKLKKENISIPHILMITAYDKNKLSLEAENKHITIEKVLEKPYTPSSLYNTLFDKELIVVQEKEKSLKLKENKTALIVEDNEINQLVINKILEKIGFKTFIANNGKEAVDMCNENKFDIIFMDLQMPIMDGYEATKVIRQKDKATPIIALSAAAMIKDKELTFEAGMNAHIAKPVDINHVNKLLKQYFETQLQESTQNISSIPVLNGIDLQKLKDELLLEEQELYNIYVKFRTDYCDTSHIQSLDKDSTEFDNYIHKLKGLSGNLRIEKLYNLCVKIEINKDENLIDQLINEIENICIQIERIILPLVKVEEISLSKEEILEKIDEMISLIENYEYIKKEKIDLILFNLKQELQDNDYNNLVSSFNKSDYKEVLKILNEFKTR